MLADGLDTRCHFKSYKPESIFNETQYFLKGDTTEVKPIRSLTLGSVGFLNFSIPILKYGSGKASEPTIVITCGIHGDEHAPLCVVKYLVEYLKSTYINGTVYIIPAANPAAQLDNKRVSAFDYKDLNRLGRGNKKGSFTERTLALLFDFIQELNPDLVINLHDFEMQTPVTAVYMNAGSEEVRRKTLEAINAFSPEMIWVIDFSQTQDASYQRTLDTALSEANIPNFPIETTQLAFLSDEEIERTAQGILNVIAYLGISEPFSLSKTPAPAFSRNEFTSPYAGLWQPDVSLLMQPIEVGMKIGTLTVFPDFEQQPVYSPSSGVLIQYRQRQLVATPGVSLFSLGEPDEQIITKFEFSRRQLAPGSKLIRSRFL